MHATGPTAAIATITAGVQSQGVWAGRRQLFVRFAAEAETATLFQPEKLAQRLNAAAQLGVHSVALAGCQPLANASFLGATLSRWSGARPVMVDCDVPYPDTVAALAGAISLLQVTLSGTETPAVVARAGDARGCGTCWVRARARARPARLPT